ncbi:hypothetical protein BT69DRAFT_1343097 [Atractiella rhizophila]|nr:hypothetical protein BT69DRAFT_1343097 [Atractiella rhizophila]
MALASCAAFSGSVSTVGPGLVAERMAVFTPMELQSARSCSITRGSKSWSSIPRDFANAVADFCRRMEMMVHVDS